MARRNFLQHCKDVFNDCIRSVQTGNFEMDTHSSRYAQLTDSGLDDLVEELVGRNWQIGPESVRARLLGQGFLVQRRRVRSSLLCTDPAAADQRTMSQRLYRRACHVAGPNSLWHLDGNHKLIRWRIVIHGGIDGFSRIIVMLNASTNNKSTTVMQLFMETFQKYGVPSLHYANETENDTHEGNGFHKHKRTQCHERTRSNVCRSYIYDKRKGGYWTTKTATESQRFTIRQVFAEFHRINNVNLRNQFYKELDRHTPKLITLFRDKAIKTGKIAEELAKLMRIYDLQEQRDVNMRRALILRALPVYLREDAFKFFRTCNSADGPDLTDTPVALLTVVTDDPTDAALFSPESISIVVI
ncbi:hypothetical protein E1301_Tti014651 [Triplophysa tibetana]|uniref:Integrase core domain-containing protein n=1 Tax=Triplophysa tibetana TaxID=1572043 RepID=A0A5A9PM99_9TELE|nr:hypothetical protein E1301_Tti014651 [Triplophysa tibetana]